MLQFLISQRFEQTVLIIHLKGSTQILSGVIFYRNVRNQINLPTRLGYPAIKFIILITNHFLVKKAYSFKDPFGKASKWDRIHLCKTGNTRTKQGTAHPERMTGGDSYCMAQSSILSRKSMKDSPYIISIEQLLIMD